MLHGDGKSVRMYFCKMFFPVVDVVARLYYLGHCNLV